ncbi:hypothetical protein G6F66_015053 [Rhizopus arrhizus]|nr:hypothetical protein G6F65_022841 [Rhizopus arrhizus]KAG1254124.1 hypothetical protein G6F66_015053 [Rhizopus arrhizus]
MLPEKPSSMPRTLASPTCATSVADTATLVFLRMSWNAAADRVKRSSNTCHLVPSSTVRLFSGSSDELVIDAASLMAPAAIAEGVDDVPYVA